MWIEVSEYTFSDGEGGNAIFINLDHVVSARFSDGHCYLYGENRSFLGRAIRPDEVLQAIQAHRCPADQ